VRHTPPHLARLSSIHMLTAALQLVVAWPWDAPPPPPPPPPTLQEEIMPYLPFVVAWAAMALGMLYICSGSGSNPEEPEVLSVTEHLVPTPLLKEVSMKKPAMSEADLLRVQAVDKLFDSIDKNHDNKVTKRELKAALKATGEDMATRLGMKRLKDIDAWIKSADIDGDGNIDRMEFHTRLEKVG